MVNIILLYYAFSNPAIGLWKNSSIYHRKGAAERGLGLKIIRQIAERYGNLFDTEYGEDYYRVTVPLSLRLPVG